MINGNTLKAWGVPSGRHFGAMLREAVKMEEAGIDQGAIFKRMQEMMPVEIGLRTNTLPYSVFLEPETDAERDNLAAVTKHMDALMRVPTIISGAVMPDACPSGHQEGTIPVGGVVATKNAIHPGFHSADICCSMAMTVFHRFDDPTRVLDLAQKITHFGRGRRQIRLEGLSGDLIDGLAKNPFTQDLVNTAYGAFATQGDGNHFLYLGRRRSDGKLTLVTHHGSRNLGALLFKKGMAAAQRHTRIVAPKVPAHNAWLDAESEEGRQYWDALQLVREWTKANHFAIHDKISRTLGNRVVDRFWNEHNFVFRRSDGLYYHGKGATPSYAGFSPDDDGRTLIPLNMREPILITEHADKTEALGFAPHGAGRNMSRTRYMREVIGDRHHADVIVEQTRGLDVRFFVGLPDLSELPGAYKNADQVRAQIDKHGLARVVDTIEPIGCIMAGDEPKPWLKKKRPVSDFFIMPDSFS